MVQVLRTVAQHLLPYWSPQLLQHLGLGNEYGMGMTLIFGHLLTLFSEHVSDGHLYVALPLLAGMAYLARRGDLLSFWSEPAQTLTLAGHYTRNRDPALEADDRWKRAHNALQALYHLNDLTSISDPDVPFLLNPTVKRLTPAVTLQVAHEKSGDTLCVYLRLSGRTRLNAFLDEAIETHKKTLPTTVNLVGSEYGGRLYYSQPMLSILEYLVHHRQHKDVSYVPGSHFSSSAAAHPLPSAPVSGAATTAAEGKSAGGAATTGAAAENGDNRGSSKTEPKVRLNAARDIVLDNDLDVRMHVLRQGQSVTFQVFTFREDTDLARYLAAIQTQYTAFHADLPTFAFNIRLRPGCGIYQGVVNAMRSTDIAEFAQKHPGDTTHLEWSSHSNCFQLSVREDTYPSRTQVAEGVFVRFDKAELIVEGDDSAAISAYIHRCNEAYLTYIVEMRRQERILYHFVFKDYVVKDVKCATRLALNAYQSEMHRIAPNVPRSIEMCNEHSATIQAAMTKLDNAEYYRKHCLKRKLGYLFYGKPGTGKTMMVSQMARFGARDVIEVPFSMVKTREMFMSIMTATIVNEHLYIPGNIILLFDEIDIGMQTLTRDAAAQNRDVGLGRTGAVQKEDTEDKKRTEDAPLRLDTVLSMLDGIAALDGIVVVATTNCKEKLDPAVYRDMRLTPLEFREMRREDVRATVERFYDGQAMAEETYALVEDRVHLPARVARVCDQYAAELSMHALVERLVQFGQDGVAKKEPVAT